MTSPISPKITVCICTFKRPQLLKRSLEGVARLNTGGLFALSIVVADNDRLESARQVVLEFEASSLVEVCYCVEPRQNIASARNTALQNAKGDFIAFIDDDEFPDRDWLFTLFKAWEMYGADGVLGPVKPFFESEPPGWVIKGGFCDRPEHSSGSKLGWRETRTGNVLLRRQILEGHQEPFRTEFGNGGEDQDFFKRMMQEGRVFIWSNEAVVYEVVPPERWKRRYMLKRALLRGQNEKLLLNYRSIVKSVIAVPLYTLLLPFLLLMEHHILMTYSIRLFDHVGKLFAVIGLRPIGGKYLKG